MRVPDGAPSRADLRRRAPQGGPALPQPPRTRRRDERGGARSPSSTRTGRARGSSAASTKRVGWPPARPRCGGSGEDQLQPGAVDPDLCRARVQLPARWRPGARPVGPRGHRARGRRGPEPRTRGRRAAPSPPSADVVSPTLGMLGRERVTITDYKSSRRARPGPCPPARAGLAPAPDLRDGLRGDDRPPAGCRRPALPRFRPHRQGRRSTRSGSPRRATRSRRPRPGSGRGTTTRPPTATACSWCDFRDICPASAARDRPATRAIRHVPDSTAPAAGAHGRRPRRRRGPWAEDRSTMQAGAARTAVGDGGCGHPRLAGDGSP